MSISQNYYIGPFVECKIEQIFVLVEYHGCNQKDCPSKGIPRGGLFCSACGNPIAEITKQEPRSNINWWEVSEEINEDLYIMDWPVSRNIRHFWLPNKNFGENPGKRIDEDCILILEDGFKKFENGVFEPAFPDPVEAIKLFEQQFANALIVIRQRYGEDNVKIRWGILSWYS